MTVRTTIEFVVGVLLLASCMGPQGGGGDEAGGTGEEPDCAYGCDDQESPICSYDLWWCECLRAPAKFILPG